MTRTAPNLAPRTPRRRLTRLVAAATTAAAAAVVTLAVTTPIKWPEALGE